DQLEMIEALVLEGSMQKAAKRLNKSQPSLSVGIKKIEEHYGIKIFSRESYRPSLTEEGKVFYRNTLEVLDSHRNLHKVATELAAEMEPQISIIMDPIVMMSQVQKILEKATQFKKITQKSFTEDVLEGPLDALMDKKAHFAIGHCPPHRTWEVHKKQVGHIELCPVVKKGLDFRKLPNIVVSQNFPSNTSTQQKSPLWHVTTHARKEELILGGYGWGRISKLKLKNYRDQLSIIKSSKVDSLHLDVFLMSNKEIPLGKVGKTLWDSIRG
ncbi:MAG: LysR family transcriptional regulator, partial [Bdellovibrionales bacterium]|nr:LysR family transcriptional regulator [Bdellovibrionales bacterium]